MDTISLKYMFFPSFPAHFSWWRIIGTYVLFLSSPPHLPTSSGGGVSAQRRQLLRGLGRRGLGGGAQGSGAAAAEAPLFDAPRTAADGEWLAPVAPCPTEF